jgi:hypothetical protein
MILETHIRLARKIARPGRVLAVAAMAGMLAACASAADPGSMALTSAPPTAKPFPAKLQHAMCVRNVTGGEATNPLWVSKVDNDGFKSALNTSLSDAGLSAANTSSCGYPIDANLLGLSQPAAGFDLTVTAHVNYKVFDPSGQPLVLETIDAPYTAAFSDALIAVERLKKANEGAIRLSIEKFFDKLSESNPQ